MTHTSDGPCNPASTSEAELVALRADLDRMRQERDAARSANQAKNAFLASISHELRTPLNAILGFSDLLATQDWEMLPETEVRCFAGHIRDSGQHLLSLINDLLDITRLDLGRLELKIQSFLLADTLRACQTALQPLADEHGVTLCLPVHCTEVLEGDPVRLGRVFTQLLTLALQRTPASGEVRLDLERRRHDVRVTVRDGGPALLPADRARLFETEAAETDSAEARLGLALSRRLVQLHGGRLEVAPLPGGGNRALVVLPQA